MLELRRHPAEELIPAEHNAQYYGDKSFPLFILK